MGRLRTADRGRCAVNFEAAGTESSDRYSRRSVTSDRGHHVDNSPGRLDIVCAKYGGAQPGCDGGRGQAAFQTLVGREIEGLADEVFARQGLQDREAQGHHICGMP